MVPWFCAYPWHLRMSLVSRYTSCTWKRPAALFKDVSGSQACSPRLADLSLTVFFSKQFLLLSIFPLLTRPPVWFLTLPGQFKDECQSQKGNSEVALSAQKSFSQNILLSNNKLLFSTSKNENIICTWLIWPPSILLWWKVVPMNGRTTRAVSQVLSSEQII